MSGPSKLRVEVLGDEIIVILPATSYGVSYCKPGDSPHLVAKNFVSKIDTGATITQAEFLAEAWQVANVKGTSVGSRGMGKPGYRRKRSALISTLGNLMLDLLLGV